MFPIPTILQYSNSVVPADTSIKRLSTDTSARSVLVQYGTWILKTAGTVWRCGQNSVNTLAYGSTSTVQTTFEQYNPGSSLTVTDLVSSNDNTSSRLGIGTSSSPTSFTACTGSVTSQTLNAIKFMCNVSNACYYAYNNKIYSSGGGAMVLDSANRMSFSLMTTPY